MSCRPMDMHWLRARREAFSADRPLMREIGAPDESALLFDVAANRALTRVPEGRFRFLGASDVIDLDEGRQLGFS